MVELLPMFSVPMFIYNSVVIRQRYYKCTFYVKREKEVYQISLQVV